jgi:pyruvate formate lyase activating enzyme
MSQGLPQDQTIDAMAAAESQSAFDWDRRGLVFDIRRFSTHDGPGIRTTVFTKGCPLRCLWCQNPEGIELRRQLFYFRDKCIGCGTCIANCPQQAISRETGSDGSKIVINRARCNQCGICTDVCPPQALQFDSREMSVREVVDEVLLDRVFFRNQGGLTISGGDPTVQSAFNVEILRAIQAEGIHTAIETSLYTAPEVLARFLPHLDLLIADCKVFDPADHRAWTGVDNQLILDNFRTLLSPPQDSRPELLVRIPLIPGHTATPENLSAIGRFFTEIAPGQRIELLNYNPLAQGKYHFLDQPYLFAKNPRLFTSVEMDDFTALLTALGLNAFHE